MRTITTRDLTKQMADRAVSMPDPAVNTKDNNLRQLCKDFVKFTKELRKGESKMKDGNIYLKFMVSQ